jgi:biofilm PGA synthesis protein PgaA
LEIVGLVARNRIFAVLILLATGVGLPATAALPAGANDTLAARHAEAIELAREGSLAESLQLIGTLRAEYPDDLQLQYDEIVVLGWAERDADAASAASAISLESAPDYVLHSLARSWRNLGDYDSAAAGYEMLLGRDPGSIDAVAGLAMSHADAGRFDEARRALGRAPDRPVRHIRLRLTEGYILERQGRVTEALAQYQEILDSEPDNRDALQSMIQLLQAALLPNEALALARQHPGIASEQDILRLEADVAALRIRFGAQSSYPAEARFTGTDRALSDIDNLLARDDLSDSVRRRLRYDRIVALTDRMRPAEAIAEFKSEPVDISEVPAYVLAAVGRAYLADRKPKLARYYLETALARSPGNLGIQFRLFYVYTDLQLHSKALELAETLMEDLPPVYQLPGSNVVQGSEEYLSAAVMVGLARAYADQLAQSQQHFEHLSSSLPHNTDIRQELANVYRWRGWIDRSLSEYSQVLAVEPDLISARVGHAHTLLDNRDFAEVEQELRDLQEKHAFEPAVRGLEKRWIDHNRHELTVETSFGESSGATFGEDQYQIDAAYYTRPFAYRYRAFVKSHDAFAQFPEGEKRRKRLGAGIEYRHKRWLAEAQLSGNREGGDVGMQGLVDYRINDFFEVGGRVETQSNSMPLRGENAGISSDLIDLHAAYAKHESTSLRLALTLQDYSDGNQSRSVYLGAGQRVVSRAAYKMTLLGDVYSGSNDKDDVPYFSPRQSLSWSAGISNDWVMYRRYDFGLAHNLTAKSGQTNQSGYDAASTWSIDYRFQADFNSRWNMYIGVSRNSNVYDGQREYATFVVGGLRGRF